MILPVLLIFKSFNFSQLNDFCISHLIQIFENQFSPKALIERDCHLKCREFQCKLILKTEDISTVFSQE